jgi:hypothetical protein
MMTCWNFGNMASLAAEIANKFTVRWRESVDRGGRVYTVRKRRRNHLVRAGSCGRAGLPIPARTRLRQPARPRPRPWTMERVNRSFPPARLLVPDAHATT